MLARRHGARRPRRSSTPRSRPASTSSSSSADRYLAAARELDVRGGGERQALAVTLTPDWGVVSLRTAAARRHRARRRRRGRRHAGRARDHVRRARHRGAARAATTRGARRSSSSPNQPQQLPDVTLAQADGRVEIASNPSEANVSVDGEFRGRTPLSLRLSPGRTHRLALTKPGLRDRDARALGRAPTAAGELQIDLTRAVRRDRGREHAGGRRLGRRRAARRRRRVTLALTAVSHAIEIRQDGLCRRARRAHAAPGVPAEARASR